MNKRPTDAVNPAHYQGRLVMRIIEHFQLGFCLGNTIKYVLRAGKKSEENVITDLEKARWYLDREIARLKNPKISEIK